MMRRRIKNWMWGALGLAVLATNVAAQRVDIATWNMEWFPGGSPDAQPREKVVQMSAAKEAMLRLGPDLDILCVQEMLDWASFEELVSVAPGFTPLVVSRHTDSPAQWRGGFGGRLSRQQIGIAARSPAEALGAWSEGFERASDSPPRGFSFAAIKVGERTLLVYSIHLKSNRASAGSDQATNQRKREQGAKQLLRHEARMRKAYGQDAVTVVCGDFNTDPTDPQFAGERTFAIFRSAGFVWPWETTAKQDRITIPSKGRYPDGCFDHFLVRGAARIVSCEPKRQAGANASDHLPVVLSLDLKPTHSQ